MTPQTRRAALRMAAKAAMVLTVGCSGGQHATPPPSNTATPTGSAPVACKPYLAGLAQSHVADLPADDPLHGKPDIYGAFTDIAARQSAQTQQCCADELNAGVESAYRWACCSALGHAPPNHLAACTPWGPPCPPEMPA